MELSQRLDLGHLEIEQEEEKDTLAELTQLIGAFVDPPTAPSTKLADSGLGSLDRIELAIRIEERFGVRVDEQVYADHETVGDLAQYITDASAS